MKEIKFTEMRNEMAPSQVRTFAHDEFPEATMADYADIGMSIAEDADVDSVLTQTGFTPLQYLQFPLNKPIEILTTPTVGDKICGRSIVADWESEEIIQPVVEGAGVPQLYGDDNDTPYASFENDFEKRTVQRFELAVRVGKLEDARMAKTNVLGYKSPYETKRAWLAKAFSLLLDEIAHRGFVNGASTTFGLLTDPNLLPAITLPNTGAWNDGAMTYEKLTKNIQAMFSQLSDQTDTHFDGLAGDKCQLVLAPSAKQALTTANSLGKTVLEWIKDNYEGCEIVAAPRFRNAYGTGANAAMLIATDLNGTEVVRQYVPSLMRLLGVYKDEKHVKEAYTCATAGTLVKQPLGIVTAMNV